MLKYIPVKLELYRIRKNHSNTQEQKKNYLQGRKKILPILKQFHRDFPGGAMVKNCLPMQGTWVWALVREDPTCRGATKPVCHNYWACALELTCRKLQSPCTTTTEAHIPQSLHATTTEAPRARAPQQEKLPQWEAHTPQQRVAPACCNQRKLVQQEDPTQPKEKKD